jgi:hypothetical protein
MTELKSKYPEKLEMRYRYKAASDDLILAWKTYNAIRKKLNSKKATDEDYIALGQAHIDWQQKNDLLDQIQSEINKFTNLKFYGNRNTTNPLEKAN